MGIDVNEQTSLPKGVALAMVVTMALLVGVTTQVLDRGGHVAVESAAPDEGACEPADGEAAHYFENPELVTAFAASIGDFREDSRSSAGKLEGRDDDEPAWLCYFVGAGESLPKAPPLPPTGDESPEPYDRLGLIVFEGGEVALWSMSHARTDPSAPPGSRQIETEG